MTKRNYCIEINSNKTAKAMAKNLPISTKYAEEMSKILKGMHLAKAKAYLNRILKMEDFLPLRKYNKKVAHRKGNSKLGVKSGRYPQKVAQAFLTLLDSVEANAEFKDLDTEKLLITHIYSSQGYRRPKLQPQGHIAGRRRFSKSTHLEVIVTEAA